MYQGNPFRERAPAHCNVEFFEVCDARGRLDRVRRFTITECVAALKLPDLQKSVRRAIKLRLEKLTGT